jgi:aminopeptidase N
MFYKWENICLVVLVLTLFNSPLLKAEPISLERPEPVLDHAWRQHEYQDFSPASLWYPPIYQEVDVLHYTMDATFILGYSYPDTGELQAVTTIDAQAKAETLDQLIIDLFDNVTLNSLKLNDVEFTTYTRSEDKIWMDLSAGPIGPGELFEITVDYGKVYGAGYQGIKFGTHGDSDTPGISTASQPYFSPGWWSCFNVPGDKTTADIYMTFPDWMTAVSNGTLQSEVDNLDGTKTAHWYESYPIYTDVLSVAMTNYTTWTDTYTSPLDGTTMTLYYYAFPEDAAKAMVDFDVNNDAMVYFAQVFGEYPFIDEKYGVAEGVTSRGSLENQTMTNLTYTATQAPVNWDVIVHELAHQWWGDWVTCATWNHLWIHEGFATYSEVLFHEHESGEPAGPFMAVEYDDGLYDGELADTVYVEDEDLGLPWVPTGAVYEKGAWVMHMLRYLIGNDTDYFNAIKAYGASHANANAVTDDVKTHMEAKYGSSLTDFFDQWLYTPYRPIYSVTYETSSREGGYKVDVNLRQIQAHSVQDVSETPLRDYYIMPVEFTVHYTDETSGTFSFDNTQRDQSFQILTTKEPDYTVFDEDVNILKVAEEHIADNDGIPGDGDASGIPGDNPCVGGATEDCDDNCPDIYNPTQEDNSPPGGNGIGEACDCEGNFDCDVDCDGTDAANFKLDFGRSPFSGPCTNENQCKGDFDCDVDVDGTDAALFKLDFGRSGFSNPCPACIVADWCSYP